MSRYSIHSETGKPRDAGKASLKPVVRDLFPCLSFSIEITHLVGTYLLYFLLFKEIIGKVYE
jgi:hypothetical protein